MVIFFLNILILSKNIAVFLFKRILAKPLRWVARLLFYKVALRFYRWYLFIIKKLGWNNAQGKFFGFIFEQRLVHVAVGVVTACLIFGNLTSNTKAEDLTDVNNKTILSSLVQSEFGSNEGDQLIEETFDQEQVISPVQQKYLDSLSSVKNQPLADLELGNPIDAPLDPTDTGIANANQDLALGNQDTAPRSSIITYNVQLGDTISTIARKFGIGVNTILWSNNLNAYSVIRPGDALSILPISGVLHAVTSGETLKAIAGKYDIAESKIMEYNKLADADQLRIGQQLIIPGGRKDAFAEQKTKSLSGIALLKGLVTDDKPVNAPHADKSEAPDDAAPKIGNKMNWPTTGYRLTQYFSWRHFAVDIADHIGTPIYAADAGVIETAGWGRGYGNQILINHGGGKKTRYAHLSKFYVKVGDQVDKGQTIGGMGSTGWSTGSHLHFEVIINGVKYNPLNYIR